MIYMSDSRDTGRPIQDQRPHYLGPALRNPDIKLSKFMVHGQDSNPQQ